MWDGSEWRTLETEGFSDGTTTFSDSGKVRFHLLEAVRPGKAGGEEKRWIRVRILRGDYGREAGPEVDATGATRFRPSTLAPPLIRSITVDYKVQEQLTPVALIAWNDFVYKRWSPAKGPFSVFEPVADSDPACYLGFHAGAQFPARSMSLYFGVWNPIQAQKASETATAVVWEYWNGKQWKPRTVEDETGCASGAPASSPILSRACAWCC
jgi:hypothetical protein